MKVLLWIGLIILVLGVVSLFVAIPQQEHHGVQVGGTSLGVDVKSEQKVSPVISAVLIAGGAAMMIAGGTLGKRSA